MTGMGGLGETFGNVLGNSIQDQFARGTQDIQNMYKQNMVIVDTLKFAPNNNDIYTTTGSTNYKFKIRSERPTPEGEMTPIGWLDEQVNAVCERAWS